MRVNHMNLNKENYVVNGKYIVTKKKVIGKNLKGKIWYKYGKNRRLVQKLHRQTL
jgi:hypothetical protein